VNVTVWNVAGSLGDIEKLAAGALFWTVTVRVVTSVEPRVSVTWRPTV
jgi:hypothetical protein